MSCVKIVYTQDSMPFIYESVAQVRADEPCSTSNQNPRIFNMSIHVFSYFKIDCFSRFGCFSVANIQTLLYILKK